MMSFAGSLAALVVAGEVQPRPSLDLVRFCGWKFADILRMEQIHRY